MSERDFARSLDAEISGVLTAVGFGDLADYVPTAGPTVPDITVFIDRDVQSVGFDSSISTYRAIITVFRKDIDNPKAGDSIETATETFTVVSRLDGGRDESRTAVIVK